jgi:holo-[acyl-carrier protein] synthase
VIKNLFSNWPAPGEEVFLISLESGFVFGKMRTMHAEEAVSGMIYGIGLDVTELDRITKAYVRRANFAERILTEAEMKLFLSLNGSRQMEFLAGRFAAKEAFSKAYGTGIGKLSFLDIEILPGENRKPEITKSPFEGKGFISITHSGNIIAAQVVLEK